jgi:methionyl-tRNA formyltransferase
VRLVFAGTPDVAVPGLRALVASTHQVVGVLTMPPAAQGRGRTLQPSAVAREADALGVPVFTPRTDAERYACIAQLAPDCCPVIAYGALLGESLLAVPTFGWINVHFSVLPRWRGAAPVQAAILAGDATTGISVFQIEEGLDTGPVFASTSVPLADDATTGSVLSDLGARAVPMLLDTLAAIEAGTAHPKAQPTDGVTVAPKITASHARIDWSQPAPVIDRLIRACTPEPGAWTMWGEQRFRIGPASPTDATGDAGVLHVDDGHVFVGTGAGSLMLRDIQAPGKRMMPAADWLRGVRARVVFT